MTDEQRAEARNYVATKLVRDSASISFNFSTSNFVKMASTRSHAAATPSRQPSERRRVSCGGGVFFDFESVDAGVLDDKRADFHRRKGNHWRPRLEEHARRLPGAPGGRGPRATAASSARLAKAEFEEREGAEEDARAAELQTKKKALVKELGECDLQIVQPKTRGALPMNWRPKNQNSRRPSPRSTPS